MEKIEPGKYVEMVYDLFKVNDDGTEELVHQVDAEDPEGVIFGVTPGIVTPLEKALEGLSEGDTFDVVAQPEEAYGQRSDEFLVTLEKDIFEIDGKFDPEVVKVGAVLPMMTQEGYKINGVVYKVDDKTVTMDFNHPLTGKVVRLRGKVTTVRDATPEEIKLTTEGGCGCGCSGNCDDNEGCQGGCQGGGCC
ncbi:MAG: peptidylprolyl isomerase [Odoribacter sp.]|nr:peptidylprolyl isomerase [Odoribacter sp.]